MSRARERTIKALLRFLREWDDVPARELSKRMAATTAALFAYAPIPDGVCRLSLRELQALPLACKQKRPPEAER